MRHETCSPHLPGKGNRYGFALVLALMLIVLVTCMVVAFFASIHTEVRASSSNSSALVAEHLADLAVQTVQGQIERATTRGPTIAWASQPGMIRNYDSTGTEVEAYKLYSAATMLKSPTGTETSISQVISDDTPTQKWTSGAQNYGIFTDINSPVKLRTATSATNASNTWAFPIVNPTGSYTFATKMGGSQFNAIKGFDIDGTTSSTVNVWYDGSTPTSTNNPAAMPVRWLYVLRDGSLVPGTRASTDPIGQVTVTQPVDPATGAPKIASSNPIIGRVAFWTDDETCKLNVNTAGDGAYFDTPRFNSARPQATISPTSSSADTLRMYEQQMAISPPVAGEYQRFVGHPAQTRLSYAVPNVVNKTNVLRADTFAQISPFQQWGGSRAGTQSLWSLFTPAPVTPGGLTLLPPGRSTLYASLDEWLFSTATTTTTPTDRVPNSLALPEDSPTPNPGVLVNNVTLDQLHFFLSSTSEAPEINLFGQPRISMWPISSTYDPTTALSLSSTRDYTVTPYDMLIARTSTLHPVDPATGNTLSKQIYYFARNDPTNTGSDYSSIPRNKTLFQYLRRIAGTAIPGVGASLSSKYSTPGMDQILTEIFDYIRSTNINNLLLDNTTDSTGKVVGIPYQRTTFYSTSGDGKTINLPAGSGQVVPIEITCTDTAPGYITKGFGRFATISEITLMLTADRAPFASELLAYPKATVTYTPLIVIGLFTPSLGPGQYQPGLRVEIDPLPDGTGGLDKMLLSTKAYPTGVPMFPSPNNGVNGYTTFSCVPAATDWKDLTNLIITWRDAYNSTSSTLRQVKPIFWGGAEGGRRLITPKRPTYVPSPSPQPSASPAVIGTVDVPQKGNYVFCGKPIPAVGFAADSTESISVKSVPLDIKIYYTGTNSEGQPGAANDLVQEFKITFPKGGGALTLHKPPTGTNYNSLWKAMTDENFASGAFEYQIYPSVLGDSNVTPPPLPNSSNDLFYSYVGGYNGDLRLIAGQKTIDDTVTPTAFLEHPSASTGPTGIFTNRATSQRDTFPTVADGFHFGTWLTPANPAYSYDPTAVPPVANPLGNLIPGLPYSKYSATVNGWITSYGNGADAPNTPDSNGDFDNGLGLWPDGPYINKPDEPENQFQLYSNYGTNSTNGGLQTPYYPGMDNGTSATFNSPSRVVASPVAFGSLPTGVPVTDLSGKALTTAMPWQTLLFRPTTKTHMGRLPSPKDEYLLDWFWMPVVDPYCISTTLATSGKVNMNYQIMPFTYITRATALLGVLGSEYVIAVPNTASGAYKTSGAMDTQNVSYRYPLRLFQGNAYPPTNPLIDITTGTLRNFNEKFSGGQIYKSAAEICDVWLVPDTNALGTAVQPSALVPWSSDSAAQTFWNSNQLTGDNSRERPYNGLYPRLTTKSNTFTVHVRAQALAAPTNSTQSVWTESPQGILAEYRGSMTINRYLDPEDKNLPDFTDPANASKSIDSYYKYRVLETRRFIP